MGSVFAFDNGHEFAKVYVLYYGGKAILVCNVIKCRIILSFRGKNAWFLYCFFMYDGVVDSVLNMRKLFDINFEYISSLHL